MINLALGKRLNIIFKGNKVFSRKYLTNLMPSNINESSAKENIDEAIEIITSQYSKKGYIKAQISSDIINDGNTTTLVFSITENDKYVVSDVKFEGSTIPVNELTQLINIKKSKPYNPEIIEDDKSALLSYYKERGFIDAYMNEDSIVINDELKTVLIVFRIHEGDRYKIEAVKIEGNRDFPNETLLSVIALKQDSVFSQIDTFDARQRLITFYNNKGYNKTDIEVEEQLDHNKLTLVFKITEGTKYYFGTTIIKGNKITKWDIFKRVFQHKRGQPFDMTIIFNEVRELYKTGLFRIINLQIIDSGDNVKDVVLEVEELKPGAVEYGFGLSSEEGIRAFVDLSYLNLRGMDREVKFKAQISQINQFLSFSYYEPWFKIKNLPLWIDILLENRRETSLESSDVRYKINKYSAKASVEKELADRLNASVAYNFLLAKTYDVQPDVILSRDDTGTLAISSIMPSLAIDHRDNPISPTKGFYGNISLKIASQFLLSETDFAKSFGQFAYYKGINRNMTLAMSVKSGVAVGWRQTNDLPLVERFFLGGRTTVRGYEQDTLGPKGENNNPTGGNAFLMWNIEMRTNIYKDFGIVNFIDAGNVWNKVHEIKADDIKYTAGIGIRYATPVGPLGLDYGYKLNKEEGEKSGVLHFSIGQAF
ncbi:Outer membrane assembly protein, YaeT [Candidatus Magnetoovum chiemensis]|nr:Outer membrane assembly protein, YaeT [Candidatus Magnetoovum chiemensis]